MLAVAMPYSEAFSAQAMAASWAASCCPHLQQQALQLDFHILHVFFSVQYGLDQIEVAYKQLDFSSKLGHSPLETAVAFLLESQAIKQHIKPGGWPPPEWTIMASYLETLSSPAGAKAWADVQQALQHHRTWCEHLKHALIQAGMPMLLS